MVSTSRKRQSAFLPAATGVDCVLNVMAHAKEPDFVFRRNGRVHLKRQGRQFSRLLAAEVCASAVVTLDTPCSEVVWRVLATHSIRQFPLHFPCRVSPYAITFQLDSTTQNGGLVPFILKSVRCKSVVTLRFRLLYPSERVPVPRWIQGRVGPTAGQHASRKVKNSLILTRTENILYTYYAADKGIC
jgi:hypothetical protein